MSGAPSAVYFRSLRQIPRHGSFNDRDDLSAGPSTSIWIFTTSATNAVPICEPTLITWPCGIEQSIKLERQPTQRTPCRSAMAGRPAVWRRKRRDKRCRSQSCPSGSTAIATKENRELPVRATLTITSIICISGIIWIAYTLPLTFSKSNS
jgi:hypothetical protein